MATAALYDKKDDDTLTIGAFFMGYKFRAALITIAIHAAILIFLWLFYIYTPIPPFPPAPNTPELELDLVSGGGGGSASNAGSATNAVTPVAKAPVANAPTINNDVEASTPIPSNTAKVQPKRVDTVPKPPQPSVELASALSKFKTAKASSNGGGNGAGSGDMGLGGTGGGTGHGTGTGPGAGVGAGDGKFGYDLNGRQLVTRPRLVTNNPEQGQIVVGITVDQDGNVTEATPGVKGTTLNDASLYELVKNAALKTKFNRSTGDTPEQYGTITFRFVIQ